jgi:hypothetical protein
MSDLLRSARNWAIAALILIGLGAACAYSIHRYTRTEPADSPIVQAFLIVDDGDRSREVFGPDIKPEPVADARLHALHGLAVVEARKLVEEAGLRCDPGTKDPRMLRCVREFSTVAGPGFWNLDLRVDEQNRVASLTATRWGH